MQDVDMKVVVASGTAILITVLIVGIGSLVLGEFQTQSYDKSTVTNETTTALTSQTQAKLLTHDNWVVAYNETVYLVNSTEVGYEHTKNVSVISAKLTRDVNYTVSSTADGQITGKYLRNASNGQPDANGYYKFVVKYQYYAETDASDNVVEGLGALTSLSGWLSLVALVVVASLVIGIIVGNIGRGGNE